jgi:transcriptional regulator with XRE-family HTH domain
MGAVDQARLRIELARRNMTKRRLAERLDLPPSTLSTWLNGGAPPPKDLAARIESALRLKPGELSTSTNN